MTVCETPAEVIPQKKTRFPLAMILISLMGMMAVGLVMKRGAGLAPDSVSYIHAARGILKGQGMNEIPSWNETTSVPLVRYAPLYSILLAAVGLLGADPLEGAKLLNILLFGLNILGTGWMTFRCTQSRWPAMFAAFFAASSFVMLELHSVAISEPAFIFLGFWGLFLLAYSLEKKQNSALFLTSSLIIGLAFLAKYSGASFVVAGVLGVLFFDKFQLPARIIRAVAFCFVACIPMGLWMARNHFAGGQATGLSFNFQPYLSTSLRETLAYLSIWLLPLNVPAWIRGAVLLAAILFVLTLLGVLRKQCVNSFEKIFTGLCLLIAFSHIGVYYLTSAFLGRQPVDDRALAPVLIALVILFSCLFYRGENFLQRSKPLRRVFFFLGILFSISYVLRAVYWIAGAPEKKLGYASRSWRESEIIRRVKEIPPEIPLYTNGPDAVYILTGHSANAIPAKEDTLKKNIPDPERRANQAYLAELEKMKAILKTYHGILVYLRQVHWRWYYPSEKELIGQLSLREVETFSDGTIYAVAD